MMMRRKVLCLALSLALLLTAVIPALGEADAPGKTRRLRLGSSIYTIEVDASYVYGEVTEEDAAAGQVAYLYSDSLAVDFDVYQFENADGGETLEAFVGKEADRKENVEELVTDGVINGIPAGWYRTVQTYNGVEYQTVAYIMEDGDKFVEIVFWLDGEDAEARVKGMMDTLAVENLIPIQLGSSPYWVFCSASFHEGGMTSEDVTQHQVAYWVSDETMLDFDVYQFSKEGLPGRLADYVAEEAASYESVSQVVPETTVNDIPVGWYRTVEEYAGKDYDTLTCVLDAGQDYVEVVFWLDGSAAGSEADAIMHSLWMDEIDDQTEAEDAEPEAAESETAEPEAAEPEAAEPETAEPETEAADAAAEGQAESMDEVIEAMIREMDEPEEETVEGGKEAPETAENAAAEPVEGGVAVVETQTENVGAEPVEGDVTVVETQTEDVPAGKEEVPETDGMATKTLRLGTSAFMITVPAGFTEGEMTQEDIADDQVAYYYSTDTLLDFDVYQFNKDGYPNALADYAAEEVSGYNEVSQLVTDGEINGIPAAWYRTVEVYQDAEFNTLTYILDGGEEYVEIVFWLDGENADAEADAIIRSLSVGAAQDAVVEEATASTGAGAEGSGEAPAVDASGKGDMQDVE